MATEHTAETATQSERINQACQEAYGLIVDAFRDKLLEGGIPAERAAALATFITAAIEGGIILSRTWHTVDPLRLVAGQLGSLLADEEPNTSKNLNSARIILRRAQKEIV